MCTLIYHCKHFVFLFVCFVVCCFAVCCDECVGLLCGLDLLVVSPRDRDQAHIGRVYLYTQSQLGQGIDTAVAKGQQVNKLCTCTHKHTYVC